MTPDFLPYGGATGDIMHPMNNIPYALGTVNGVPYNALGQSGTGWAIQYLKVWVCTTIIFKFVSLVVAAEEAND